MTTIKLKNGSGAPTAGDLAQGEPALDLTNKRLYTEDSGGTVIEVGTNPTSVTTGDITATGTATFAGLTTTADVSFGDNDKAIFGAGSDLQIYHDGSNSYITEGGTGDLLIRGASVEIQTGGGNKYFQGASGITRLYHTNNEKFATTATGVNVTGTVTADGLTVDGNSSFTGDFEISGLSPKIFLNETDTTDVNSRIRSSGGKLEIQTVDNSDANPVTRFEINHSTGNVSIPSGDLDVTGTVTADGLTADGATDGTAVALLRADNNSVTKKNTLRFEDTDTTTQNDQQIGRIEFYSNDTQHTGVDAVIEAVSATNNLKELRLLTSETANTPLSRLAIDRRGDISFYEDTGTTAKLFWDASAESLGIGTSSPDTLVHLSATADAALRFEATDTTINSGQYYGRLEFEGNDAGTSAGGIRARIDALSTGQNGESALVFNTSGVGSDSDNEAMRIDSSGNVGIGTSPSQPLHVDATGGTTAALFDNNGTNGDVVRVAKNGTDILKIRAEGTADLALDASGGAFIFKEGGAEAMRIDTSGNLLVGRTSRLTSQVESISSDTVVSAHGDLTSHQTSTVVLQYNSANNLGMLRAYGATAGTGQLRFNVGGGGGSTDFEAVRIDSSGNLLVNTTSQSGRVTVDNGGNRTGIYVVQTSTSVNHTGLSVKSDYVTGGQTGTMIRFIQTSDATVGTISSTITSTAYNTSSDQRLKDNIVDAPSASDDIDAIQVRSFDWKADGSHQKYGMVAQELQSVAPEAVSEGATEEDMMGVDYSKLVPMLVKEIQSLRARVAQLEGAN